MPTNKPPTSNGAPTRNKRILVTGASRGIGKSTALRLAQDGYSITVHYHTNKPAADEVMHTIEDGKGSAMLLAFDVSNREQTQTALLEDIANNGAYYGVICNAGITKDNAFPAMPGQDWDKVIHTNLDSFSNVLNPLIMPMIRLRQGGRIVTISSIAGLTGNRGQVNYSAAKAGIIGATKALATELGKRKITVNCIAPGVIETDMAEGVFADEIKKIIPLGAFGKAEDVAATVAFLISDEANYITRQVISVNGGMV
jgi:3-oxoacyl-[acyl-carrier protein] reductase